MPPPGSSAREGPEDLGTAIVRTKLGVPTLRLDTVSRPRLLRLLDASTDRVVLVSAPAGSGKSVLVQDWLKRREVPAAWLSLDELDNGAARFLIHLAAALGEVDLPGVRAAARAVRRLAGSGRDLRQALPGALETVEEGTVLVLDDCHVLESPALVGALEGLLAAIRTGPRCILLSRVDPPVPLGRLRLSGQLLEIRQRELQFSTAEAAELFRRSLGAPLPDELVARLEDRTEGWAAGLRLAAITIGSAPDRERAAEDFAGSNTLLVDYLVEEALAAQTPEIQRFLLDTSVLSRFDGATCVAVTGDARARDHLRAVDEANLFLVSLDGEQRWYRYHHLFGELLRFRLGETDPERMVSLRERASRWFEEEGDVQEALVHAAGLPDAGRLVELLDRHGYDILARSEFGSFSRWLQALPDPLSWRHPMFLAALTWFRTQTERVPRLEEHLTALEAALDDPPPGYPPARLETARLHRAALRSFGYRILDRFPEALAAGEEALLALPHGETAMRGILEFNMGAVHLRLADMPEARAYLERAWEHCLGGGGEYLVLASLAHLGIVAAHCEGLAVARRRLEDALAFAEEEELDRIPACAIVLYQLADVHWLACDLEPAMRYLERGLEITRGERETDIRANVLIRMARVAAGRGEFDLADAHLTEASALAHGHNVKPFATTLDVERARLEAARKDRRQHPAEAPPSAETSGMWTTWLEAETVLQLQHCLQLGLHAEAESLAARLRKESEPRERGVALCVAGVAEAALVGDARARREKLVATLSMAASREYVGPLVQGGAPVRRLLESALKYPLPPAVQAFVRDTVLPHMPGDGRPDGAPSSSDEWGLTEKEEEVLRLLSRGRTNSEMARELFVSVNTVKTHLKHIYAKLGVGNRTEAARTARRFGLVPIQED